MKRHRVGRALDDLRGDLARHDLAEQAVSHAPPEVARSSPRPPRPARRSRSEDVWAAAPIGSIPRREQRRLRSSGVSPPSGPTTTVTGAPSSRGRRRRAGRHRPASDDPHGCRAEKFVEPGERAPPAGAHAAPHCLIASSAWRRSFSSALARSRLATPRVRSVSSGTMAVAPSSAAFSTSQPNRSRSPAPTASVSAAGRGARSAASTSTSQPLPAATSRPCPTSPAPSRSATALAVGGPPDAQVVLLRHRRCARAGPADDARRHEHGDHARAGGHGPPAGIDHLVPRRRSPAASERRAGTAAPPAVSMPEKMAEAAGRAAPRRSPAAARCSRCGGCWREQVGGAEQRREVAGVAVEELRRRRATPLRSAFRRATGFASASFSMPTAHGGAELDGGDGEDAAAAAEVEHPIVRGRRCRSSSVSAARVEPCSPLPNALSGSSDDRSARAGVRRRSIQDGTTVRRPKRRGPSPSRQRVDQSTGSSGRRAVSTGDGSAEASAAISASAACSSSAKVTSVPSSRSSTAWPVRATSHAPTPPAARGRAARRSPTSSCAERFLELGPESGRSLGRLALELARARGTAAPARRVSRSGVHTCTRTIRSPLVFWPSTGSPRPAEADDRLRLGAGGDLHVLVAIRRRHLGLRDRAPPGRTRARDRRSGRRPGARTARPP